MRTFNFTALYQRGLYAYDNGTTSDYKTSSYSSSRGSSNTSEYNRTVMGSDGTRTVAHVSHQYSTSYYGSFNATVIVSVIMVTRFSTGLLFNTGEAVGDTGVRVNLSDVGQNTGDAAGDTFSLIDGVQGSALADVLIGNTLANVLVGNDGSDVLVGAGDTSYGGEKMTTTTSRTPQIRSSRIPARAFTECSRKAATRSRAMLRRCSYKALP